MWDTANMQTQKVSKIPPVDGTEMCMHVFFVSLCLYDFESTSIEIGISF